MLEENWDAVQAFQLCKQSWVAGIAGAFALGFTAQEIEAGCRLVELDKQQLRTVADQVREMGDVAANALNERKG